MSIDKQEFICTAHYVGQEFTPPNYSYKFVSSQIVSHDDFKQETYIYVTWKKMSTAQDRDPYEPVWDEETDEETDEESDEEGEAE